MNAKNLLLDSSEFICQDVIKGMKCWNWVWKVHVFVTALAQAFVITMTFYNPLGYLYIFDIIFSSSFNNYEVIFE